MVIVLALFLFVISDSKASIPRKNQLLDFKENIPGCDERKGRSTMYHSSLAGLDLRSTENQNPVPAHLFTFDM